MNKAFSYLRRSLVAVVTVVAAGVLFTACLKNKDDGNTDIPAAGLMAFNLAPDQQSVIISLSGSLLTQTPLAYTNYTGTYQSIYTGSRNVEAFDYPNNSPLASVSNNFELNKYYSVFVVGADSNYRNVVSVDNFDSLSATSGNAYVRYINAITDSVNIPNVSITAGGNSVVNENGAYAAVSEFKAVAPGDISIAVKNNNGVDVNRTISVEQKKVYTILLSGVPGATDDVKKVQIKFISNGSLTDSTGQ
jgi:Domain of unknown function (DUF4397)